MIERGAALPQRRSLAARIVLDYLPPALLLVGLIAFWEAWVTIRDTPAYRLPAPSGIWEAFWRTRETLPEHVQTTMNEALLGLGFGAAAGVFLAAAMASINFVRRALYPLMVISQTIPMIVLAPLLTIWFGFEMTPKIIIVALVTFFPVLVGTTDALLRADAQMLALIRSMGASRVQTLRYVMFPSAIPGFFSGFKIAAAYAVTGAVIAELISARSGLGLYISRSHSAFRTDQVFVGIVLVALLSVALFAATHLANRLVAPWLFINEGDQ